MCKRAMIIVALVMSLVSMVVTTVEGQIVGDLAVIGRRSVEVESILKQLKNTDITEPAYEVVMFLQVVSATCVNPAGQTGEGQPFSVDNVAVSESQNIDSSQITKNGRFLSEIIFSDAELAAALAAAHAGCDPNWTTDQIVVHALQVFGTLFSCRAGGDPANPRATGCAIADTLGKQCFAPAGVDLFNVDTFEYECVTICDDPDDPCPQPPTELPFP